MTNLKAFFGHHKGATKWVTRILRQVCREQRQRFEYLHNPRQFNSDLRGHIDEKHIDFVAYVNADIQYIRSLSDFKAFHIRRDPRDTAVSSYFSHRYSHPTDDWEELKSHRLKLESLPQDEGLLLDLEFIRGVFDRMQAWDYGMPHCLELKYEDVIANPERHFQEIFFHLGLLQGPRINPVAMPRNTSARRAWQYVHRRLIRVPLSAERLMEIVADNSFSRLAGRSPGQEDAKHHYRKGIAGDWKNYFKEQHKQFFKQNYSDLLEKLGYEIGSHW